MDLFDISTMILVYSIPCCPSVVQIACRCELSDDVSDCGDATDTVCVGISGCGDTASAGISGDGGNVCVAGCETSDDTVGCSLACINVTVGFNSSSLPNTSSTLLISDGQSFKWALILCSISSVARLAPCSLSTSLTLSNWCSEIM